MERAKGKGEQGEVVAEKDAEKKYAVWAADVEQKMAAIRRENPEIG